MPKENNNILTEVKDIYDDISANYDNETGHKLTKEEKKRGRQKFLVNI